MAKMRTGRLQIQRSAGMVYSPLQCDWQLDEQDLDVNYIVCAHKPGSS
jgi:2-polyprenyl-3-methyl-5-hydroxy-6-metoxy-1,4-benzoquinol methylase